MKNYDFTDLVLLVGHNPLPVYVVGEWFLREKGDVKIWLVHTTGEEGTEQIAINISKLFRTKIQNKKNIGFWKITSESVPKIITKDTLSELENLKDNAKIHLNYTGSTKSMSVHVHKTIREYQRIESEFSYLDSREYKIIYDNDETYATEDLRKTVQLDLDTILNLHGLKQKENEKWKEIKCSDDFDSLNCLEKISEHIYENEKLELLFLMNKKYDKIPERKVLRDEIKDLISPKEEKEKFLSGKWLEQFIALEILQNFPQLKVYINVKAEPEVGEKYDFELDIVLLNGYQLIGISCTTDTGKKLCKEKGFEVLTRTRQLGGDESKAILICGTGHKQSLKNEERDVTMILKNELKYDTGGSLGKILVMGKEEIKNKSYIDEIRKIIK